MCSVNASFYSGTQGSLSLWEAVQGSGDGGPGSQTAWQVTLASATNQMLDLNGHVISQSPNLLLSGCL